MTAAEADNIGRRAVVAAWTATFGTHDRGPLSAVATLHRKLPSMVLVGIDYSAAHDIDARVRTELRDAGIECPRCRIVVEFTRKVAPHGEADRIVAAVVVAIQTAVAESEHPRKR